MTSKQIDQFLSIFDRAVKIAERWADREYPVPDERQEITISRVGDKPLPQSVEEYAKLETEVGRFETRFRAQS